MNSRLLSIVALTARCLIAFIFLASGLGKLPEWNSTLQYMASEGLRPGPLFLVPAIAIEILGGLAILIGFRSRLASLILAVYLIPVTLIFHDFWALAGAERQLQLINLMKNLAIIGGLLSVTAHGPGALSIDGYVSRAIDRNRVTPIQPPRKSA